MTEPAGAGQDTTASMAIRFQFWEMLQGGVTKAGGRGRQKATFRMLQAHLVF